MIVNVNSGPRARSCKPFELTNGTEYTNEEIIKRLSVKVGKPITSQRIQRGTERIHNFLVKKAISTRAHRFAAATYDKAANTIPLEIDVTEGPRVQIVVTGMKLSSGTLKKLVPIYQEGSVDVDLLEEGKRNIRERLERDGYFDAAVDYTTVTKDAQPKGNWKGTEEIITYKVERGDRHRLYGIEITGNHYFNTELLRSRLQIFGKGFLPRAAASAAGLVESDRDVAAAPVSIQRISRSQSRCSDARQLQRRRRSALRAFCNSTKAKQSRVASLCIEGNHAFKEDDLLPVRRLDAGPAVFRLQRATDRDNILALYYNEGFPAARSRRRQRRSPRNAAAAANAANGTANGTPTNGNGAAAASKTSPTKSRHRR